MKAITVHAHWDDTAAVWVATSDDVEGLVVEASSAEELAQELKAIIPVLLSMNGNASSSHPVPVELLQTSRFNTCVA